MRKYVLIVTLASLSIAGYAQEKSPKKEVVYRKIEIKGNDTIVDVTKNYDQLSEAERKELDQLKEIKISPDTHRVKVIRKLDSAGMAKLKKEGKWVESKDSDVFIVKSDSPKIIMDGPGNEGKVIEKRINKRVEVTVDSTGKRKVIVINADGPDDEIIAPGMIDEDIIIEGAPKMKGERIRIRKQFSPEYDLNFKLPTKGSILVSVNDEDGKEVYKETINNFAGSFSKTIELHPGKYQVSISQKGKQILSYSFVK
ncbi:hypothetical protein NF867_08160 [Solitalea sp. MAHUQ-68]|uniref:Uncharacterized protein n=1 Tax=Solitalea agri TaxID=2953739 RepID=A0A9X2F277_9SPHI|nr:hypothetical protein [Solitalea agri]MCO4292830.1 hypothetical protein [Solitalea agri]